MICERRLGESVWVEISMVTSLLTAVVKIWTIIKFVNIYYNNLFDFISDKLRSNNIQVAWSNCQSHKLSSCQAIGFECK